jgi:hypothetical protein
MRGQFPQWCRRGGKFKHMARKFLDIANEYVSKIEEPEDNKEENKEGANPNNAGEFH